MKQFLRYQISGTVFVGWVLILYVSAQQDTFHDSFVKIFTNNVNLTLGGAISALPIGVIIHQISVLIKNVLVARCWSVFSDRPDVFNISGLDGENKEQVKYILERVSNLNSFYYVRFDNGFLAPFLALIFSCCVLDVYIFNMWYVYLAMGLIGFYMLIYILDIKSELEHYRAELWFITFIYESRIPLCHPSCPAGRTHAGQDHEEPLCSKAYS